MKNVFFFRYRLTIGHQTCIFEKENDPTLLRSTAPGKLLNFVVEEGSHVNKDEPYAEIEVFYITVLLNQ